MVSSLHCPRFVKRYLYSISSRSNLADWPCADYPHARPRYNNNSHETPSCRALDVLDEIPQRAPLRICAALALLSTSLPPFTAFLSPVRRPCSDFFQRPYLLRACSSIHFSCRASLRSSSSSVGCSSLATRAPCFSLLTLPVELPGRRAVELPQLAPPVPRASPWFGSTPPCLPFLSPCHGVRRQSELAHPLLGFNLVVPAASPIVSSLHCPRFPCNSHETPSCRALDMLDEIPQRAPLRICAAPALLSTSVR
eukprot:XP_020397525.1 uncharacterized protein LOC103637597 [Zea mays]